MAAGGYIDIAVLGNHGVELVVEIPMADDAKMLLHHSAGKVQEKLRAYP